MCQSLLGLRLQQCVGKWGSVCSVSPSGKTGYYVLVEGLELLKFCRGLQDLAKHCVCDKYDEVWHLLCYVSNASVILDKG